MIVIESLFQVLPDGTLLIEGSEYWWVAYRYHGQRGKELIHIINNANYGSTAGIGEGSHPYVTAQLQQLFKRHCTLTLDQTIGNVFP